MPTTLADYLWNLYMDGDGENVYESCPDPNCPDRENCDCGYLLYTKFEVTPEERVRFNLPERTTELRLYGENYNEARVRTAIRVESN